MTRMLIIAVCVFAVASLPQVSRAENPVDVLMAAATNLLALMGDILGVLELSGSENGDEFDWEKAIETTRDYMLGVLESDDDSTTKDRLLELGEDLKIVPDYAVDVAIAMAHTFKENRDDDAMDLVTKLLESDAGGESDSEESGLGAKHLAPCFTCDDHEKKKKRKG